MEILTIDLILNQYICILLRAPPAVIPEEGEGDDDDDTTMSQNRSGGV
jgi:hypothetical protein